MKYIFRGVVVFDYDPITRQVSVPDVWEGKVNAFNHCKFIPEDFILISDFFRNAHLHSTGQLQATDLKDIKVS